MHLPALPKDSPQPLYQLVKERILTLIQSGEWTPGQRIASENVLVTALQVSRMTINRALRELAQEGHLQRVHGVGTFVAEPPRHASLIELRNIATEIREQGHQHRAQVLLLKKEQASPELAQAMELTANSTVFHAVLVHFQDELPIQIEDRYVNPTMVPDFLNVDFSQQTPTEYLIQTIRPDELEHIVQAILPDTQTYPRLAIDANQPCLRLTRRTWSQNQVVTRVTLTYPSNRYDLSARYRTEHHRIKP